jgi:hypothetical protein
MKQILLAGAAIQSTVALADAIPLTADRWEAQGDLAFETRDGRPVMRIGSPVTDQRNGAVATIKGLKFTTGVIEYEVMLPDAMEFSGPLFRQPDENTAEFIYFRPHMNGKPDAIQYTPIVNGGLNWQIFTGPGFEAQAKFPLGQWMKVRVDVYANSALVSLDGKPALAIPDLKNSPASGDVSFAGLMGGSYYSNINVQPIADYKDPAPKPPVKPLPEGIVATWQVSEAMTQADAFERASARRWAGVPWHAIAVETNGVANLSKAGPDGDETHSFIARFTLASAKAQAIPMQFGFSDDVRIYLNGAPLYEGSDRQNSRDYRFLGHVGFWDTVFLPLKAGANDVTFVVTDPTNGGTAAAAILPKGFAAKP